MEDDRLHCRLSISLPGSQCESTNRKFKSRALVDRRNYAILTCPSGLHPALTNWSPCSPNRSCKSMRKFTVFSSTSAGLNIAVKSTYNKELKLKNVRFTIMLKRLLLRSVTAACGYILVCIRLSNNTLSADSDSHWSNYAALKPKFRNSEALDDTRR